LSVTVKCPRSIVILVCNSANKTRSILCRRFDDRKEANNRRPSSQPETRDTTASDFFAGAVSGMDDHSWLDMASGPESKNSSHTKTMVSDRPRREENVADEASATRHGNSSCLSVSWTIAKTECDVVLY